MSTDRFDIIAKTGDYGLVGMEDNPSINDIGKVAFIGQFQNSSSQFESVFVGDGSTLTNISPKASSSSINFTRGVQINNKNQVVAHQILSGFPLKSAVRVWDANNPDSFTNLISTASENFISFSHASINNIVEVGNEDSFKNNAVFSALQDTSGLIRTPVTLPTFLTNGTYQEEVIPTPIRPMISDDGIIVRFGNTTSSPLFLYKNDLSSFVRIADVNQGFTNLGQSPGISDNGKLVTFYGNLDRSIGEVFTDSNSNKVWDRAEVFTDSNGNGGSALKGRIE